MSPQVKPSPARHWALQNAPDLAEGDFTTEMIADYLEEAFNAGAEHMRLKIAQALISKVRAFVENPFGIP